MNSNNKLLKRTSGSLPSWMIMVIVIVGLWGIFSILSPYFFAFNNIMNLLMYAAVLGVTSAGMLLAIVLGTLDLSVGSVCAFCAVMSGHLMQQGQPWGLALLVGILLGCGVGALNGFLVTKVRMNPLIATLGTMTIFRGMAHLPHGATSTTITDPYFKALGSGYIGPVPTIVVIMGIVFVIMAIVVKYTTYGRSVFSVGGNEQASYVSGINVIKTKFFTYLTVSGLAGFAGLLQGGLTSAGVPTTGENLALESISAVVLGGAALSGGTGSIFGTILGVIILGTISNGLSLLNLSSYYQMIFKGVILLVAVGIDSARAIKNER